MAGWVDAVSLAVKYLPELRKLVPLMERVVSPEARREQQERMAAAVAAAEEAKREARASHDAVTSAMMQVLRNQSELQTRIDACEQRVKDASADIRRSAELQDAAIKELHAARMWIRIATLLIGVVIVLVAVVLWRR